MNSISLAIILGVSLLLTIIFLCLTGRKRTSTPRRPAQTPAPMPPMAKEKAAAPARQRDDLESLQPARPAPTTPPGAIPPVGSGEAPKRDDTASLPPMPQKKEASPESLPQEFPPVSPAPKAATVPPARPDPGNPKPQPRFGAAPARPAPPLASAAAAQKQKEPETSPEESAPGSPAISSSPVTFAVFAPGQLPRGSNQMIDLWACQADQLQQVRELAAEVGQTSLAGRKAGVSVASGAVITVSLSIPSFGVKNALDEIQWLGQPANASFAVQVPQDAHSGGHAGEVKLYASGARIARIRFSVQVGEAVGLSPKIGKLPAEFSRISRAFASYASADRAEVLGRIQGMKTVFPDLDIFVDALSLQAGEHWSDKLVSEITSRDVFYLFWSENAAKSAYVEKEWRLALEKRGLDYIDPVPLQVPSVAPPPPDLSSLHFADAYATFAYFSQLNRKQT